MRPVPSSSPAPWRAALAALLGVAVLVFVRLRRHVPLWMGLHRWLDDLGLGATLRNLDASLLLLLASAGGAAWTAGKGAVLAVLGLAAPVLPALALAALAGVPMLAVGAAVGEGFRPTLALLPGVIVAPFVEEVFYRGLLVGVPVRAGGFGFWPVALLAGLLFGASHVPWSSAVGVEHVPTLLVTGVGGVWFAWLYRAWRWNLWATIALHAAMNLAWMLFDVADDAVGGLWPNVGRAATIALATVIALRRARASGGS